MGLLSSFSDLTSLSCRGLVGVCVCLKKSSSLWWFRVNRGGIDDDGDG